MHRRHEMSITLPRNFSYSHNNSASIPATPSSQIFQEHEQITEPPPPPRQTFKVRRRRVEAVPRDITLDIDTDTLPCFAMTSPDTADADPVSQLELQPQLLAPQSIRQPLLSPPRTPLSQMTDYTLDDKHTDWASMLPAGSIARPDTAFSDSSVSSCTTDSDARSSFSLGSLGLSGSGSSPDSENSDPFSPSNKSLSAAFSRTLSASPTIKRKKSQAEAKWTSEMDNHLWYTYLRYLQDPELTPFKMLPGTAPPLGVCGRVAREAKHSWKASHGRDIADVRDTDFARNAQTWSHWPSSESGTRRRLRRLCRKTFSLSAHYQRLLQTRSPSPFPSSSSPQPRPDIKSSSTVVPASDDSTKTIRAAADSDPFADFSLDSPMPRRTAHDQSRRMGRSQAHQKSHSLQWAVGHDAPGELASPFGKATAFEHNQHSFCSTQSLGRTSLGAFNGLGQPALKSPLELHAPRPTSRSLKRRFGILDNSPENVLRIEKLFSGEPTVQAAQPPGRDRAFSLDAVFDSTRNLSMSFERNPPIAPAGLSQGDVTPRADNSPQIPDAARLGSPFVALPGSTGSNTFPRRVNPTTSDMFVKNGRYNLSLEGKFRKLAAENLRTSEGT